jgi:hypothetical protein
VCWCVAWHVVVWRGMWCVVLRTLSTSAQATRDKLVVTRLGTKTTPSQFTLQKHTSTQSYHKNRHTTQNKNHQDNLHKITPLKGIILLSPSAILVFNNNRYIFRTLIEHTSVISQTTSYFFFFFLLLPFPYR